MKYTYGNLAAVKVGRGLNIVPTKMSHIFLDEYLNDFVISEYTEESFEALCKLEESDFEEKDGWWREVGRAVVDMDEYQPRIARRTGLHLYICDRWGASQPRNVAAIIGSMAAYEAKTPVELFNSFRKI